MDPISVGACSRAINRNPLNNYSIGVVELEMHLRRVLDSYAKNSSIGSAKEANALHITHPSKQG